MNPANSSAETNRKLIFVYFWSSSYELIYIVRPTYSKKEKKRKKEIKYTSQKKRKKEIKYTSQTAASGSRENLADLHLSMLF